MKKTVYRLNINRPKSREIIARFTKDKSHRITQKNGEYFIEIFTY